MPAFVVARRQDGHGSLRLAITAQHVCCSYPTDVFLMYSLPRKYPCSFAPPKGIEKQKGWRGHRPRTCPFEKVVPAPPRLLSSCYVHFHQKQAKWKMPSPLFSSPETGQDLQLTFPALLKVAREKGTGESLLSRTASKLSTGDLTLWDKGSGRWAKPAKSDLSKASPCLKHGQVDSRHENKAKDDLDNTNPGNHVLWDCRRYGERVKVSWRRDTFVPSWETADPHRGPLLASLSSRCRKSSDPDTFS